MLRRGLSSPVGGFALLTLSRSDVVPPARKCRRRPSVLEQGLTRYLRVVTDSTASRTGAFGMIVALCGDAGRVRRPCTRRRPHPPRTGNRCRAADHRGAGAVPLHSTTNDDLPAGGLAPCQAPPLDRRAAISIARSESAGVGSIAELPLGERIRRPVLFYSTTTETLVNGTAAVSRRLYLSASLQDVSRGPTRVQGLVESRATHALSTRVLRRGPRSAVSDGSASAAHAKSGRSAGAVCSN